MSDNQRFDDHIKDQFRDYSPDVHPRIWENIIKEREKRRPAGFWLNFLNGRTILLATALLLVTGSAAYLFLKNDTAKDENITAVSNTTKNNTPAATDINTGSEKNNNTTVAETSSNKDIPQTTTTPGTINNGVTDNTAADVAVGDVPAGNNTGSSSFTNAGTTRFKISSPFAQADNDNNKAGGNKKKNEPTGTTADDYEITDATVTYDNLSAPDSYLKRLLFADMQKITADKSALSLKKRLLPDIFLPDCPSIEKNAAGNKTYFEVYGGPDIAFRNLTDTGNSAYLQKRKESTKFSSAFSAGIRYTKVFNNGVSIRTGVNYSQVNEKFTYAQGNVVQITYIINANGDTTGSFMTTGTRYKTTVNKYKTIDVPLLVGYELGNGRFHANINAGVIINAYSWQKGEVLDTAFKPVSITTGKGNSPYQYKTNIGLGFMVGTSVYYKLNEKLHLLAEPYFRYSLAPMSNEKLTFKQKNNTAGLRIGLRVDLH